MATVLTHPIERHSVWMHGPDVTAGLCNILFQQWLPLAAGTKWTWLMAYDYLGAHRTACDLLTLLTPAPCFWL